MLVGGEDGKPRVGESGPQSGVYRATHARLDATVARLIVARKIGKTRLPHLREFKLAAV